jgi:hypothetical protein
LVAAASFALPPAVGLNTLPQVEFAHRSQREPNPPGPESAGLSPTRIRVRSEEKLIRLAELMALTYPPSDRVETFYDESEWRVRFLATTDKRSFLSFLDALGRQGPFETALEENSRNTRRTSLELLCNRRTAARIAATDAED